MSSAPVVASTSLTHIWDLGSSADVWSEASGSSESIDFGRGSTLSVSTTASLEDVSDERAHRLPAIKEIPSLKLVPDSNSPLAQRPHQRKRDKVKACLRRSLCCFGCESADSFGQPLTEEQKLHLAMHTVVW